MEQLQNDILEQLYHDMSPLLFSYANSILHNAALAEEAVQDTFCIACAQADSLFHSPSPQGWLMNTLKNVLYHIRRSHSRFLHLMEALELPTEPSSCDEINIDVLYGDFAQSRDFQLLKYVILEQHTLLETARHLNISLDACQKRVQRAKMRLRRQISEQDK